MKKAAAILVCFFSLVFSGPIEDLQPNCWYEVPNSHLLDCPERATPAQYTWLTSMFGAIYDTWCGGSFDTQRDQMLVGPGGGHASYNGNEVYGFNMNTLQWHRLTNPDPVLPNQTECTADSVPFAMHTYDGADYMPAPVDRYLVVGGWCTPKTYALDQATKHWEVFPASGLDRTGDASAYNPNTGLFYFVAGFTGKMATFNYQTGSWQILHSGAPSTYYSTATLDFKRNLLITVGGGSVRVWNLNSNPVTYTTQTTTGATGIVSNSNPGCEYDPVTDRVVCWYSGATIYTLNTDTWVWTSVSPSGSNTVTPPSPLGNGTYGRFRYVPSKNVFVLTNHVGQNVLIYRLSASTPVIPVSLNATLSSGTVETDLSYSVSATVTYSDNAQKNVSDSLFLKTSTPNLISITGGRTFKALAAGSASLIVGYTERRIGKAVYDTLTFTVGALSGSVILDSIVLNYAQAGVVVSDSVTLQATGFYSRSADHFTRNLDATATWTSSSPSNLTVSAGLVRGLTAGGPFNIVASLSGKSDTARVTVYAEAPMTRINFQPTTTPWKTGWLADNGGAYNATNGYGWTTGSGFSTREDRLGTNYLLKSFVQANPESNYKVNLPNGRYILRLAMGDNQWGGSFIYTRMGTDTLCTFVSGANAITTNYVDVTGGNGLILSVKGEINYLVVMADNGIDFNRYSDDGYAGSVGTASEDFEETPETVCKAMVCPNPLNPTALIKVSGHLSATHATLKVFSPTGKLVVRKIVTGSMLERGVTFNGASLASGVYLIRIEAGSKVLKTCAILMK